jgi:hypothetical protein
MAMIIKIICWVMEAPGPKETVRVRENNCKNSTKLICLME